MGSRRVAPRHRAPRSLRRSLRRLSAEAISALPSGTPGRTAAGLCAAGLVVSGSVAAAHHAAAEDRPVHAVSASAAAAVRSEARSLLAERQMTQDEELSRSAVRLELSQPRHVRKSPPPAVVGQTLGGSRTKTVPPPTPRQIAMALLPSYGWSSGEFSCLDAIWTRESDWNPYASNSTSGAYGIPQALPGAKMAAFGSDWQTNARTQIRWGLWYIRESYGSPCGAWAFWQSHDWY